MINDWKHLHLENLRPKPKNSKEPEEIASGSDRISRQLVEIKSYLFREGKVTEQEFMATLVQAAKELGYSQQDAERAISGIFAYAKDH